MLQFDCIHCQKPYQIPDEAVGVTINCPHCNQALTAGETPKATTTSSRLKIGTSGLHKSIAQQPATNDLSSSVVNTFSTHKTEIKPGYKQTLTWIYCALAAIIVTMVVHGVFAGISIKFKPLPNWTILYIPMLAGIVASVALFMAEASKGMREALPKTMTALGLLCAITFSFAPAFITESIYNSSIRAQLAERLMNEFAAPEFPVKNVPAFMATSIGKASQDRWYPAFAVFTYNKTYELKLQRNVSKLEAVDGIMAIKSKIAEEYFKPTLLGFLKKYDALKDAEIKSISLSNHPKPGLYEGIVNVSGDRKINIKMQVIKDSVQFTLSPTFERIVNAISPTTKLWGEFDPEGKDSCSMIEITKEIDPTHWDAVAILESGKKISIIIEETIDKDDQKIIRVFLPFKETAIMAINKFIKDNGKFGDQTLTDKCVNIDEGDAKRNKLRNGQYIMQAQFVESPPSSILISEDNYVIQVMPGNWQIFGSVDRNPQQGWAMVIPSEFRPTANAADKSTKIMTKKSKDKEETFTLNSKAISDFSRFDLGSYVKKERDDWAAKVVSASTTDVEEFKTSSGLPGYKYYARNQGAFRAKYFFVRESIFAIMTYTDSAATDQSQAFAELIASTLRYKDNPKEASE